MRDAGRAQVLLIALVLNLATSEIGMAGDWPQNYIVHKNSESPVGRYGVLVFSNEADGKEDQTEGNTTYLANLQTHQTLGEIHGTDYFDGQTIAISP